jgi:hypothetical protein
MKVTAPTLADFMLVWYGSRNLEAMDPVHEMHMIMNCPEFLIYEDEHGTWWMDSDVRTA